MHFMSVNVRRVGMFAVLALTFSLFAFGDADRKIVKRVAPVYPAAARAMHVTGVVKLELTVGNDGNVRNTKVLGGHPLLTEAAVEAVSHWQYEPGPEETVTVLVDFK